jgi:hypothetical protein
MCPDTFDAGKIEYQFAISFVELIRDFFLEMGRFILTITADKKN